MPEAVFPPEILDVLDQEINLGNFPSNKRVAVRYRRKDIRAVIKVHSLLFPRLLPVLLHDISSKGAAVMTSHKIGRKSRVCLHLLFNDGRRFQIEALVVHWSHAHKYGLKFDHYHELLADHLLHTQTDLTFS